MRISLLCPSKGRPDRFMEMARSAFSLAKDPSRVYVCLLVERSDGLLGRYLSQVINNVSVVINDTPKSVPALFNDLYKHAGGDILMASSDDIVFRTKDWDQIVEEEYSKYPDRILLAYTNDGRDRDKVEHFFVSREWVNIVGLFMYPGFNHFSADEYVGDIAKRVGRSKYLKNLVTEHMHFKYGKSQNDRTYIEKREKDMSGLDREIFRKTEGDRIEAAARLKKVMDDRLLQGTR